MKTFLISRWQLVKTDRPYRSAFRLGSMVFAVLMLCFMSLPSCTYTAGGLTVDYPSWQELFYGGLTIGDISLSTGAMWPAFVGYLACFFAGFGPYLLFSKKLRIWSLVLSILGFILVVCQPVITILNFTSSFPDGSYEFGLGYILPLVYSLAILVCNAVVTVVEPRGSER